MAIIHGNDFDNKRDPFWGGGLNGTNDADFIYGYGGNDDLYGEGGDDWLDGGTGADHMRGGGGNDTYIVDSTGDIVEENDQLYNPGYDTVRSSINYVLPSAIEKLVLTDNARVGEGNSLDNDIRGTSFWNDLYGNAGKDELWGYEGDDHLYGGTGDDILHGDQHRDELWGGAGNDWLFGGSENDTLYGESGHDHLIGGTGADTMYGGIQNDIYEVDNAGDVVVEHAGEGLDEVESVVSYTLTGNVENLDLIGTAAINGTGNSLANYIDGNAQNNILNGRGGADVLRGAGGQDQFVFDTALGHGNLDTIADFNVVDDTILLDNAVFTALPAADLRVLSAAEFRVGSGAMDTSDRIIYNSNTGALLYDVDGIGAQMAVQFASIGTGLNITQNDFVII